MTSPQPNAITRPPVELSGTYPGYGFAGLGVNTAIGNFTIRADVPGRLRSEAGQVAMLHVAAADPGRATEAVRAALPEISRLAPADAPAVLMGPFRLPDGCLLLADFEAVTPPDARAQIPDILARHLDQDGITEAEISTASQVGSRYDVPGSFTPVARAWLAGPGLSRGSGIFPVLEPAIVDAGTRWLSDRLAPGAELRAILAGLDVPVAPEALDAVLAGARRGGTYAMTAVATDFSSFAASTVFGEFLATGISLSAAGASWTAAEVTAQMRAQREIIRSSAAGESLAWAGVTAQPGGRFVFTANPGARDYRMVGPVWYQLLSADQLQRMGGQPPGATGLPGGRVEVTIGEPEQWLPGHPDRATVETEARRITGTR